MKKIGYLLIGLLIIGLISLFIYNTFFKQALIELGTPPLRTDIFRGNFSPTNRIFLSVNETKEVIFSISPDTDVSNTTTTFYFAPWIEVSKNGVKVNNGDTVWEGNLKKDDIVRLRIIVKTTEKTRVNLRASVEGYIANTTSHVELSYYALISTEKEGEWISPTRVV